MPTIVGGGQLPPPTGEMTHADLLISKSRKKESAKGPMVRRRAVGWRWRGGGAVAGSGVQAVDGDHSIGGPGTIVPPRGGPAKTIVGAPSPNHALSGRKQEAGPLPSQDDHRGVGT